MVLQQVEVVHTNNSGALECRLISRKLYVCEMKGVSEGLHTACSDTLILNWSIHRDTTFLRWSGPADIIRAYSHYILRFALIHDSMTSSIIKVFNINCGQQGVGEIIVRVEICKYFFRLVLIMCGYGQSLQCLYALQSNCQMYQIILYISKSLFTVLDYDGIQYPHLSMLRMSGVETRIIQ